MQLSEQGTNLIAAVIAGLLVGTALAFVGVDGRPLTLYLLQDNSWVLGGRPWELVTSIIVAPPTFGGLADVVFNAIALAWLDSLFSLTYSKRQYYAVFLSTGVAGNLFSLANGPGVLSFGASGGIFGLLAGVVSFDLTTNERLNPSLMIWFAFIFIFSSFLFSYVDWLAHAGGAVLGLVLGFVVGFQSKKNQEAI